MTHRDSTKRLASLLRVQNDIRPVWLFGAGCSFSSGVPLAAEGVRRIAKRVFAEKIQGGALLPEQIKLTEWQSWLQSHSWFIKGDDRLAENFPLLVQHLLTPREYRTRVLLDLVQPLNGVGLGYRALADLVMRGLVRTMLTTNFDVCLPIALNERRPHIRHVAEVNRRPDDFNEFHVQGRAQIVWLHGKAEQYTDRNASNETERLDNKLVQKLLPMLDSPLVVAGYRGAEASVMEHLLSRNAKALHYFKHGVYWCSLDGETLHPNVDALRRKIGDNFCHVIIKDFDTLMADLAVELAGEDAYSSAIHHAEITPAVAFDDSPAPNATQSDLDFDVLLVVMREYCKKLGRAPVTSDTINSLLREQGLLVTSSSGVDVPTNGCILLFGKQTQNWFPHAVVVGSINGKKSKVFSGNLIQQRRSLLEWLDSADANPIVRVKRRSEHEDRAAYEPRALVELLMNMLVHRDYELPTHASINVSSGESVTFVNPGSLVDSVATRVQIDEAGRFRPVPMISSLRNRGICDVFFGIRAMERAGTGLSDVEAMSRERGGDAVFSTDKASGQFTARVKQPMQSAGSTSISRDPRHTGVYLINVLPFASVPEFVTILPLLRGFRELPAGARLLDVGTFLHNESEIWSFAPADRLLSVLAPIADESRIRVERSAIICGDSLQRPRLSWLLRKHFERYLAHFFSDGLVLEESLGRKSRRAYFEGRERGPRTLVYDSARRKGIQRQVVKQRDGVQPWFENEGFGYEITRLVERWGVRIKPFYMFTGRDARTPLPAFARTSRATRRMKFDRNKNVEDDLTFWSRFLSNGCVVINIGQEHVSDLLVEGSFISVEVFEEGLLPDGHKDRMPA